MLCGLALKRIELPPKHFFFILKTRFFAHFFTPKNTLVIVAQILLYMMYIYLYIILRYRKEIRFKRTKRFLYPNAILLRYVLIHQKYSLTVSTLFLFSYIDQNTRGKWMHSR